MGGREGGEREREGGGGREPSTQPTYRRVRRLVLCAPALGAAGAAAVAPSFKMPILLLWARDDLICWYSTAMILQEKCTNTTLTLHSVDKGGHCILDSYIPVIEDFLG